MVADKDLQSIQEVRTKVAAAYEAFLQFRKHTQEEVDRIVDQAAAVARANAESLAKLAVKETGYGNVRDKTIKNLLNSDLLHRAIRPMKTVGVIGEDPDKGILEIAEPAGVVAAILPTTNPTSTAFFKILIALKSKNAIVLSPHPRAVNCTCESARLLAEAAEAAGAPQGCCPVPDESDDPRNERVTQAPSHKPHPFHWWSGDCARGVFKRKARPRRWSGQCGCAAR